ncbi:hypothetical protein Dda_4154 [Drechslerella dactyloides]|uniref:Uncharacterized protein n=1 Tax=Drechslerella dactyloides TaxID=74499 RepID=A0AAD6J0Q8_DREDA|nr:hypothetical protein Dda_4154 [Drechslerella dactyloides]
MKIFTTVISALTLAGAVYAAPNAAPKPTPAPQAKQCETTHVITETLGPTFTHWNVMKQSVVPIKCSNCKLVVQRTTVTVSGFTGSAPTTTATEKDKIYYIPQPPARKHEAIHSGRGSLEPHIHRVGNSRFSINDSNAIGAIIPTQPPVPEPTTIQAPGRYSCTITYSVVTTIGRTTTSYRLTAYKPVYINCGTCSLASTTITVGKSDAPTSTVTESRWTVWAEVQMPLCKDRPPPKAHGRQPSLVRYSQQIPLKMD